jgi:hypothetical protein
MRALTAAGIAGAAVILVATALSLRSGDADNETTVAPARVGTGATKRRPEASLQRPERGSHGEAPFGQGVEAQPFGQEVEAQPEMRQRNVPPVDPNARQAVAPADDSIDDPDAEDPDEMDQLRSTLLSDPDPDERSGAAFMLTGEEGPESLSMLVEAMGDPDPEVRRAVVEALDDRVEELSPDTFSPALQDPEPAVRLEALNTLGDMAEENPAALQMVRAALNDPNAEVRALAASQIEESDTSTVPDQPSR